MKFCTGCGNRLGTGRFCTSCGRPVDGDPQPEAAAPAPAAPAPTKPPPSRPPPPAYTPPTAPRFPLFSDELYADKAPTAPPTGPPPSAPTYSPLPGPTPGSTAQASGRRPGISWLAVALTVVILMLVGVIGGLLLFVGGDDEQAGDPTPGDGATQNESPPSDQPPTSEPADPTDSESPQGDGPQDVAGFATVTAAQTAKPNLDTKGNVVRYVAANMVDDDAETCWRMPGDGTGQEITFALSGPTELTEVGLINGYAKRSGALDWYAGNRRILSVEWVFDDGTVVSQSLSQSRNPQTVQVEPVTTSTVVLRLVSVSPPGRGPSARNYTPISDVSLIGTPED